MKIEDIEVIQDLLNERLAIKATLENISDAGYPEYIKVQINETSASFYVNGGACSSLLGLLNENILLAIEQHLQDIENTLTLTYGIELED